ncbi:NAD(P)/FAD-dependent oxidoreductase [Streptomyces sp. NPDC018026]|uniref:NAD(P)/FAD-dependent oxidoreductase n=1 Tax=Streptomyces sp. NPDC018026 TaxID=3365031 RepID=UPI0037B62928
MKCVTRARGPVGTVCVLGGSVAGLLAARVLSDHAERVVVLERDRPADGTRPRPSVPQGRHGHFLQPQTLPPVEQWFPGITDDLLGLGALLASPGHHELFVDGSPIDFPPVTMLMATRPLLENELRRRVESLTNVEFLRARVTGVAFADRAARAVTYHPGEGDGFAEPRSVEADLVVDAMGRGSRLAKWLEEGGFPVPDTQRETIDVHYTTALFARARVPDVTCALDQFTPGSTRPLEHSHDGGLLSAVAAYAVEDDQWQVVAIGGPRRRKISHQDIREICAGLPKVFQEATEGEAIGAPESFSYAQSMRRSLRDGVRFPGGLLDIGDCVASFNPVHGQGVWSAVRQASLLADHLTEYADPLGTLDAFIAARDKAVDEIWSSEEANT